MVKARLFLILLLLATVLVISSCAAAYIPPMEIHNAISLTALPMAAAAQSSVAATPSHIAPSNASPTYSNPVLPSPSKAEASPPPQSPTPSPQKFLNSWEQYFSAAGPYKSVLDPVAGPWIYKDQTLSVRVDTIKGRSGIYFRAEVYTKGPQPFAGFANKNPTGRGTLLPYKIARQYKAVLGITSDYLTHRGNPKGVMIRDGKVYFNKSQAPTLAILPDGQLQVFAPGKTTASKLLAMGVKNSFAFGPILVQNGKPGAGLNTHRLHSGNYRAAIGQIEKGHYIFIVTKGGYTLSALAKIFIDNKCTLAYNMDGGHSASMVFMGEQIFKQSPGRDNRPQRPLPDLMLLGYSAFVPAANAPVFCDGVHINQRYKPKPFQGLLK